MSPNMSTMSKEARSIIVQCESASELTLSPTSASPDPKEDLRNDFGSDQVNTSVPRNMSPIAWTSVVVSLLFSMFLFSLDNVIVANIQPSIIQTFGNVDKLPWISVGYALGATSVNLFVAKLFVSFENKSVFIIGVAIFEIGSLICGAAPTMTALIFGRVVCGVGCTAIYVGNMNLLSVLTTEAERPLYLSFVGLTWGLGTVLGPVIGGAFADGLATWRWSFYLNLCIGAFIAPIYIFLLPSHHPRPDVSITARVRNIDWAGTILFAGACVCLTMGISFGGSMYPWGSAQIIALFVVAGILWAVFALQQTLAIWTTKENRLIPFTILTNWEMQIFFIQIAAAVTVVYVPMYFIPLYFQFVQNETALRSAVHLLPFVFTNVFGIIFNGAMMGKFGHYMPWYLVGGIMSVVGGSLFFTTVTAGTSPTTIYGYSVLCGLGSGLFVQASFAVSQAKVKAYDIPHTVAFLGCGQILGITMALTISNVIFLNEATNRIAAILPSLTRTSVQNAITGVDSAFLRQLDSRDRALVLEAIVKSINNVYPMVIAAGVVVVALSFLMKREKLFIERPAPSSKGEISEKV